MKKRYEDMTTEELLIEMHNLHEAIGFTPEPLKVNSDGVIILDPENEADRYWIELMEEE